MENVLITLLDRNVLEYLRAEILKKIPKADLNNLPSKIDTIKHDAIDFMTATDHIEDLTWVWNFDGGLELESLPIVHETENHGGEPPFWDFEHMGPEGSVGSNTDVCYGCSNRCKGEMPDDCVPEPEDHPENTWEGEVEIPDHIMDAILKLQEEWAI
jgi:hypothetical protein